MLTPQHGAPGQHDVRGLCPLRRAASHAIWGHGHPRAQARGRVFQGARGREASRGPTTEHHPIGPPRPLRRMDRAAVSRPYLTRDTRRQVLLDEANAIGTTYLRTGMLPERREDIRTLLRDYVDVRLAAVQSGTVTEGIRQSERLQDQLWAQAVALGEHHPTSIVVGLFVQSLHKVIDLHAKRVTAGLRNRIPGAIWVALCAVAVLSLAAMGYHAGLARTSRSLAELAVAFTFSVVIGLIADLDRPQEGLLKVSQQALIDLRQSMQVPRP